MSRPVSLSADALVGLRERVRSFIRTEVLPREDMGIAHDVSALDHVTRELQAKARTAGLFGPQLPREWGGLGLNWTACCARAKRGGRCDAYSRSGDILPLHDAYRQIVARAVQG